MTLLRALPLLLLATPVLAQPAKKPALAATVDPRLKAEFAKSDTNKDGVLSRAEVDARIERMNVGKTKVPPERSRMLAAVWFARADANKDGKVTPFEMQKLFRAMAQKYDTNGDGVVSIEERAAARAAIAGPGVGR